MPGGFFKRALQGDPANVEPTPIPPETSKHQNVSWLSVLASQNRRPSVGLSNNLSGDSALMDEDSNSDDNFRSGIVIPKASFFGDTSDTPSPGEDSVFGMGNMAIKAAVDNGPFVLTVTEPMVQLDQVASNEIAQFEARSSQIVRPNASLSDVVTSAISIGDFPVATQESLAQLEEMKQRLQAQKEDDPMFSMEVDQDQPKSTKASYSRSASDPKGETEKPPSKLLSYVLKKSFAQNWFFKNEDEAQDSDQASAMFPKKSGPISMESDDNASFGGATEGHGAPKAFSGLLEKEAAKQKRQFRETNFMAPQNL